MNLLEERQNFYLAFGEADLLPGLFIQYLNDHLLIQVYAGFWRRVEKELMEGIAKAFHQFLPANTPKHIWIQERNLDQRIKLRSVFLPGKKAPKPDPHFQLEEFGIRYQLKLGGQYDFGLYTDMAAQRKVLSPYFSEAKSVLNLYAYTGAYSLFALSQKCERVVSIDLSEHYLNWLEENLELNPDLERKNHQSILGPVAEVLESKVKHKKKFDLIICDPPSASHDGKQTLRALQTYEKTMKNMATLLEDGGKLVCFLNTHRVIWKKFHDQMEELGKKNQLKIVDKLKLSADCLGKGGFPEGDYLKGLVFQKNV